MPDVLQTLLAKKDRIAKMPEQAQRSLWGFAFSQSVAPKLREAAANGAKLEDEGVSRERFITSMLGKPQTPSAEPSVAPPGILDKSIAAVGAAGAGVADVTRNIISKIPAPSDAPLKPMLMDILGQAASSYPLAQETAPSAAPVAAAVGHQIPSVIAFEAGASAVPALAGGVEAGSKAPAAMRALQTVTRTGLGTAAMDLTDPNMPSGTKLAAQAVGFSLFDALTHGFFSSMRSGGADAASVLGNLRSTVQKVGNGTVSKEAVSTFNDMALDILRRENPQAFARIAKGEKIEQVLPLAEQVKLSNRVATEQAAAQTAAKANEKTAKQAAVAAEKASKGLEAMRQRAQRVLDKKAEGLKMKALQRELSAYAKATGKVPAEGSEAMKALQNGAKAADVVKGEQASVVQRVAAATDVNDAIAMNEEAPAVKGMVEDLQALAEPATPTKSAAELNAAAKEREKELLTKAEEHRVATEAQRAALPGGVRTELPATAPKPKSAVKQKIAASANEPKAYEKFGIVIDASQWKTPEDVVAGKRAAMQELIAAAQKKYNEVIEGLKNGTLSKSAADALQKQIAEDSLKAGRSIEKVQVENVSRKARDRIRKAADAAEGKRAVGEKQAQAEKLGTSSAGAQITEQEAIDEIDTLVKIGFGSTSRQAVAKKIIADVEAAGGGAVDKLEALQDAYEALKKAGK